MIRSAARQLRSFLGRSRERGHGRLASLFLYLPGALCGRAWRKLASGFNNRVLTRLANPGRLADFQRAHASPADGRFYVIVMPGTLHYLIPCLRRVPPETPVCLVHNGSAGWERELLAQQFAHYPALRLLTLPRSSLGHGQVITLLLEGSEANFGLLDHDLFVHDPAIFRRLQPGEQDIMTAVFRDRSEALGRDYPHTWLLYLNTARLRELMRRYRVTACTYRRPPRRLRQQLAAVGLAKGVYLKPYLAYFDTLQLLLALAWHEGMDVAWETPEPDSLSHLGGTSMGSLATKDLVHLYTSLRFLEYLGMSEVSERYLPHHAPFTTSAQVVMRLPRADETLARLRGIDALFAALGPGDQGNDL